MSLSITSADFCTKIETTIRSLLREEPPLYDTRNGRLVKDRLCELGKGLGFEVLGSGCAALSGERLYDMVWAVYEPPFERPAPPAQTIVVHFLTRQAMVMELEWKIGAPAREDSDVDEDFAKLVQARADVRVWMTRVRTLASAREHIEDCKKQIQVFPGTLPCDQYLFVILTGEPKRNFMLESYRPLSTVETSLL